MGLSMNSGRICQRPRDLVSVLSQRLLGKAASAKRPSASKNIVSAIKAAFSVQSSAGAKAASTTKTS